MDTLKKAPRNEPINLERKASKSETKKVEKLEAQVEGLIAANKSLQLEKQKLMLQNAQLNLRISVSKNLVAETLDTVVRETSILLGVFACFLFLGELVLEKALFVQVFTVSFLVFFVSIVFKAWWKSSKGKGKAEAAGKLSDDVIKEHLQLLNNLREENMRLKIKLNQTEIKPEGHNHQEEHKVTKSQLKVTSRKNLHDEKETKKDKAQFNKKEIGKTQSIKQNLPITLSNITEKSSDFSTSGNNNHQPPPSKKITSETQTAESSETSRQERSSSEKRDLTPCKICKPIEFGEEDVFRTPEGVCYHNISCVFLKDVQRKIRIKLKECSSLHLKPCKACTPREIPDNIYVYATKTGARYHKSECEHLKASKIPIKLKELG